MRLTHLKTLAMTGAVALGFAMSGTSAWAACATAQAQNIDAQDPFTIHLCATVENTFATTVDDVGFGNVGATGWNGESGCLIMDPDGTFDESNTACLGSPGAAPATARIVSEDSAGTAVPGTPGAIVIAGAFPDQEVRMWFQLQETTNEIPPLAGVGPSMWISQLTATTDAAGAGSVGTNNNDGVWEIGIAETPEAPDLVAADTTAQDPLNYYSGQTDATTGDLTINIGATIQTDSTFTYNTDGTGDRYASDDFEGTFEVVLFY